ncbi:MAG TPA: HAD family hydrolase [Thermoplasmata archaeon]|nr:HAD family hydrolase [Thermoplasmata archaeon]
MIHAVLFDLGGTLIDNADPLGWCEVARDVGVVVDPDHLAHAYREVQTEFDANGEPETPGFWAAVLGRAAGRTVDEATARSFQDRWFASGEHHPPLFSDARYCLETLQQEGIALGLVSNSQSEAACRDHLTRLGVQRFFPVVVSSGTEGVRKPDPEIFRRAVQRIGVRPEEAVYVGDLPHTDAKGAAAAGLHGLWLHRYGWGFGDDPPEITSLTEVPNWVKQFNGVGVHPVHGPP